jgi:hypothetical protein
MKGRKTAMKNRCCTNGLGCLVYVVILLFLWAGAPTKDAQANDESKKTEAAMNLAHKIETESPLIPTIDAAAPAAVETASFGLG